MGVNKNYVQDIKIGIKINKAQFPDRVMRQRT
jgi:hypothetical protein